MRKICIRLVIFGSKKYPRSAQANDKFLFFFKIKGAHYFFNEQNVDDENNTKLLNLKTINASQRFILLSSTTPTKGKKIHLPVLACYIGPFNWT